MPSGGGRQRRAATHQLNLYRSTNSFVLYLLDVLPDAQQARRILTFLHERVAKLDDPRSIGQALHGSRLGEFRKYRVGDYRLICKIEDDSLIVLALRIGHGKEIYR